MKNLCSWEHLEVGKTYEIYATFFDRENNNGDVWHVLLLDIQINTKYGYEWVYTFLTKIGLKKFVFHYNDDIWFSEVDNPEIWEQ